MTSIGTFQSYAVLVLSSQIVIDQLVISGLSLTSSSASNTLVSVSWASSVSTLHAAAYISMTSFGGIIILSVGVNTSVRSYTVSDILQGPPPCAACCSYLGGGSGASKSSTGVLCLVLASGVY